MELPYNLLPLEQDTPEWHFLRKNCIGSSDAAAIMGVSKWDTPRTLYRTKKGIVPPKKITTVMQRGKDLEEQVRHSYMLENHCFVAPCVVQSKEHPRIIASLDGLSFDGDRAIEIKCGNKEDHETVRSGKVPVHYWPQVQHALSILKDLTFDFVSFHNDERIQISVKPDWDYIQELQEKELEFLGFLDLEVIPGYLENEHIEIPADLSQLMTIQQFKDVSLQIKKMQETEKKLKQEIISWTDDGNADFINDNGERICRLTRINRDGAVDWVELCKHLNITDEQINNFKKQQVGYWKIC